MHILIFQKESRGIVLTCQNHNFWWSAMSMAISLQKWGPVRIMVSSQHGLWEGLMFAPCQPGSGRLCPQGQSCLCGKNRNGGLVNHKQNSQSDPPNVRATPFQICVSESPLKPWVRVCVCILYKRGLGFVSLINYQKGSYINWLVKIPQWHWYIPLIYQTNHHS